MKELMFAITLALGGASLILLAGCGPPAPTSYFRGPVGPMNVGQWVPTADDLKGR